MKALPPPFPNPNLPVPLKFLPEHPHFAGSTLRVRTNILQPGGVSLKLTSGISILAGVRECLRANNMPISMLRGMKIYVAESTLGAPDEVPRKEWGTRLIREGMFISVVWPLRGGGGKKNPLNTILTIVVIAAATIATSYLGASGGYLAGLKWSTGAIAATTGAVASAIMIGGMLLVNAIAPMPQPKLASGSGSAEQVWSVDGIRNRAALYEPVPMVFGKVRFAPRYLAQPYTFLKGSDQYLRCLFGIAGRNKVSSVRIGDTDVATFKGVRVNVHENWEGENLSLFPSIVIEDSPGITLRAENGYHQLTTARDCTEIQFEIFYARGLGSLRDNGKRYSRQIDYSVQYRPVGTNAWLPFFNGTDYLAENRFTLTPFRVGYVRAVPEGQYDFRIWRRLPHHDPNDKKWTVLEDTVLSAFRSVRSGQVVKYDNAPMTLIELEIKATDQLNGYVEELNCVFESYAPTWNGETWADAPSGNPAALGMLLATSTNVRRNIAPDNLDSIDLDAWKEFYLWCEEMGWKYNSVQTSRQTCRELLQEILSSGRAAMAFNNGRYSVVWDTPDKATAYIVGPRNSWGWEAQKNFVKEQPHGLRYLFLNETADFQEDERIVYADGYDEKNATNIVTAEQAGTTNPELIYKHGRLRLADSIWRPEVYSFNIDFAFLAFTKGDRIEVSHDVPLWGLKQARVVGLVYTDLDFEDMTREELAALTLKRQGRLVRDHEGMRLPACTYAEFNTYLASCSDEELMNLLRENAVRDESRVSGVIIDDYVTMESGRNYSFVWFPSGSVKIPFSVETNAATTNTLLFPTPVSLRDAPAHDGLISFGEAGRETHDCIVTAIETNDNMSARITCQDYSADKIYKALTEAIPPWDSDISLPSRWQLGKPEIPTVTTLATDEYVLLRLADGTLVPRIQVGFLLRERANVEISEVRIQARPKEDGAWQEFGGSRPSSGYVYAEGVDELVEYEIRLYAVSTKGVTSEFSPVYTALVIGRTTAPPAPAAVYVDGDHIWWEMPDDPPPDIKGWEVWMGFDASDPFAWARRISNEYVTAMEFDISAWSGWARRLWIRTRDDVDLVSDPVSVAVNLGDVPVDNVIHEVFESRRGWPGRLAGGAAYPDLGLVASGSMPAWGDIPMWGDMPFAGGESQSMTYETTLVIPPELDGAMFKVDVVMPYGVLGSVEYAVAESYPAWGNLPMWGDLPWSGILDASKFQTMKNDIIVNKGTAITLRVTTSSIAPARIREIILSFDVEDAMLELGDISIAAEGARVPVPEHYFRWISVANVSVQYTAGGEAFTAGFTDRGVVEGGFVTQGPLIQCKDINGTLVRGSVDVILQGAKGAV